MRIHIVSAYPAVRAGLAALLAAQPGWTVTAGPPPDTDLPGPPASTTPATGPEPADVLLLDAADSRAVAEIADMLDLLRPASGVVVLGGSSVASRRDVRQEDAADALHYLAQAAGAAGLAFGLLRRDAAVEEVILALTAVAGGVIVLDRRLGPSLATPSEPAFAASAERTIGGGEALTPRELEVLQLVALGLPNKTIAARLHVSEHTAKFHVSSIMLKLGAASRTEAVTLAARRGLLIL
jgi:DNA-binding CsgD family transcriptional regulator